MTGELALHVEDHRELFVFDADCGVVVVRGGAAAHYRKQDGRPRRVTPRTRRKKV